MGSGTKIDILSVQTKTTSPIIQLAQQLNRSPYIVFKLIVKPSNR